VFDATSAGAHARHNAVLRSHSKQIVDLTPAAIGPYLVPAVNMHDLADQPNVNLVTCGGQATIPIVAAITRVAPRPTRRSSPASRAVGGSGDPREHRRVHPHDRARTRAGRRRAKGQAIIVLNPADPPLIMRNTVFCLVEEGDAPRSSGRSNKWRRRARVRARLPPEAGRAVRRDLRRRPARIDGSGRFTRGLKVSCFSRSKVRATICRSTRATSTS
jgi:acetaldehyde dehydrogenase